MRGLKPDGAPIWASVDTGVFCYRLNCPRCGRARFAKRNNLKEIKYCWICTKQDRYRRHALHQFRERDRTTGRQKLTSQARAELVRLYATGQYRQTDLALMYGVTRGWVSRILKADSSG
jgi:hypothetical protein